MFSSGIGVRSSAILKRWDPWIPQCWGDSASNYDCYRWAYVDENICLMVQICLRNMHVFLSCFISGMHRTSKSFCEMSMLLNTFTCCVYAFGKRYRICDQGRYLSKSAEQSSEPGCGLKTVTLLWLLCSCFSNMENISSSVHAIALCYTPAPQRPSVHPSVDKVSGTFWKKLLAQFISYVALTLWGESLDPCSFSCS